MLTSGHSGPGHRQRSFEDMRVSTLKLSAVALLAATSFLAAPAAMAVDLDVALLAKGGGGGKPGGGGGGGGGGSTPSPTYYGWMASDVDDMWALGYKGAGSTITVVDDFSSGDIFEGRLNLVDVTLKHHGDYTSEIAGMIAPGATVVQRDWSGGGPVRFGSSVFNVVNASYSLQTTAGYNVDNLLFSKRDQSLIDAAWNGTALMAKAAGNESNLAVGDPFPVGTDSSGNTVYYQDYLGLALIGAPGAIFVGALQSNGTTSPASIASYSTIAGSNQTVQAQFLVVGVDAGGLFGDEFANYGPKCGDVGTGHCLYGTSFAAPVVAGYAAIVGSKFGTKDAAVVASKLLDTAREDTIADYNIAIHGMGEACLSCALAPVSLQ
jgi:hypothetical protein